MAFQESDTEPLPPQVQVMVHKARWQSTSAEYVGGTSTRARPEVTTSTSIALRKRRHTTVAIVALVVHKCRWDRWEEVLQCIRHLEHRCLACRGHTLVLRGLHTDVERKCKDRASIPVPHLSVLLHVRYVVLNLLARTHRVNIYRDKTTLEREVQGQADLVDEGGVAVGVEGMAEAAVGTVTTLTVDMGSAVEVTGTVGLAEDTTSS